MDIQETLELLIAGTDTCISHEDLEAKLKSGRKLRVKLGVDPTAPDIHLGHTVAMQKLRQFQDLGHQAVLIIGDFTAMIGDPTGKSTTRPPLTREEVLANAETYKEQAFKVLDREKTEVVYNGTWFNEMTYSEVLKLNSRATMQQMLQREDFKTRVAEGQEVRLHELQYPIMQGWDSVMVKADVELGGTDQRFNNLVGRDLQKQEGMEPQVVILVPILEGLDGVKKMSKSLNNYIGVADPPFEMFDKLMKISDELMDRYYLLLLGETRDPNEDPRVSKKNLALKITTRFHSEAEANEAAEVSAKKSSGDHSAGAEEVSLAEIAGALTEATSLAHQLKPIFEAAGQPDLSLGRIRKDYIAVGRIELNGEKLKDPAEIAKFKSGDLLKLSKKLSVKFV